MSDSINQTITVVENGKGISVRLDEQGREQLRRANQFWCRKLGLSREPLAYVNHELFAQDVTGFVRIGGLTVEVIPKFLGQDSSGSTDWRRSLWAILTRLYEAPVLGSATLGEVTTANRLPDLMGLVMLNSLRWSKASGRPMGYVREQKRLQYLRGRLDVGHFVDSMVHVGRLSCEYDAYSEDIPTNRLLKWAATQLSAQVRTVGLAEDLLEEGSTINAASLAPSPTEAERISLAPYHASLQPALTVAQVLLAGRGLQHGGRGQELPGFLWKSSAVFERFARNMVQTVVNTRFRGIAVTGGRFAFADACGEKGRQLWTNPDLRMERGECTVAVLDAKYKVWESGPRASDAYQVVTGAWVRNSAVAVLLYPSPRGTFKEPIRWTLRGRGSPLTLWALFLNLTDVGSPASERALMNQLTSDLSALLN